MKCALSYINNASLFVYKKPPSYVMFKEVYFLCLFLILCRSQKHHYSYIFKAFQAKHMAILFPLEIFSTWKFLFLSLWKGLFSISYINIKLFHFYYMITSWDSDILILFSYISKTNVIGREIETKFRNFCI